MIILNPDFLTNVLIALGKSILHSLWIGFSFLILMKLALAFISELNAEARYRVSIILFFGMAFVILGVFIRSISLEINEIPSNIHNGKNFNYLAQYSDFKSNTFLFLKLLYPLVSITYIAGLFIYLIRWNISWISIIKIKRRSAEIQGEYLSLFNKIKFRTGIKRKIGLRLSNIVHSPFLIGLVKPCIVVPASMFSNLPVEQVELILLHELSHFRRNDFLANLLQSFVEMLLFYHPAVRIMSKTIRLEREKACDDDVIYFTSDKFNYIKALESLASIQLSCNTLLPAASSGKKNILYRRLYRILNSDKMKTNSRKKLSAILLTLFGIAIMIIMSGFNPAFSIRKNAESNPYLEKSGSEQNMLNISDSYTGVHVNQKALYDTIINLDNKNEYKIDLQEDSLLQQKIRKSIEEIDWEEIHQELGEIKIEVNLDSFHNEFNKAMREIENINWEKIQNDFEIAISEFEGMDFDEIMENARKEAAEIDIERIMEDARKALEDVDMEKIMNDARKAMEELESEIDIEQLNAEIQKSIKEIDFEEIKKDIEREKERLRKEIDTQNPSKHKEN